MTADAIRRATIDDLPILLGLLGAEWPQESSTAGAREWRERLRDLESNDDGHPEFDVWLLEQAGTVTAAAATQLLPRRRHKRVGARTYPVYLMYLAVHPGHRGRACGRRLEDHLGEHLRRRGYSGAYLLVEPGRSGALRFWERQGWKRADTADQPPTRVLMTKEITSWPSLAPRRPHEDTPNHQ